MGFCAGAAICYVFGLRLALCHLLVMDEKLLTLGLLIRVALHSTDKPCEAFSDVLLFYVELCRFWVLGVICVQGSLLTSFGSELRIDAPLLLTVFGSFLL